MFNKYRMFQLAFYIVTFLTIFPLSFNFGPQAKIVSASPKVLSSISAPTPTVIVATLPTVSPVISQNPTTTTVQQIPKETSTKAQDSAWGVAKKIDSETYTVKVGEDSQVATPQEILDALNNYRAVHGKNKLEWSQSLADFAQSRADLFNKNGALDNHAGFNALFQNTDNVKKMGFMRLGENSAIGYKSSAVHLIEWVYASDAPHNDHVFGGNKIN